MSAATDRAEWARRRALPKGHPDWIRRSSNPRPRRFTPPAAVGSSSGALAIARRHARWGVGGSTAAVTGVMGLGHAQGWDDKQDAAALAGATAGQAAYQGAGVAGSARVKRSIKEHPLTNQERKQLRRHRKAHGIPGYAFRPGEVKGHQWTGFFRNYPKNLPAARLRRVMGHTHGGWAGTAIGAAVTAGGAEAAGRSARNRRVNKALAGQEFHGGAPYEQYSAESQRRRTTASATGYRAAQYGATGTAIGMGSAKLAGTKPGQHAIRAARAKMGPEHELAGHMDRAAHLAERAGKHRTRLSGGILAASALAAGAHQARKYREDEAAGMSQGIGRLKAGRRYQDQQAKITKGVTRASASLAFDLALNPKHAARAQRIATEHRRALIRGGAATGAVLTGAAGAKIVGGRHRERNRLRTELASKGLFPKRVRLERMARATHDQLAAPMWSLHAAGGDNAEAKRLLEIRRLQRTRGNVRVRGRTNRGAANVGKRLVDEESKTSMLHLAGVSTGMAAIAWGGSRSKGLRRALRAGGASPELDPRVRRALNLAEHTRQGIEHSTSGLGRVTGRGIGRMPGPLREALNDVPRGLRPATATLAGAILVQHSRPVRRKSYSPVVQVGRY